MGAYVKVYAHTQRHVGSQEGCVGVCVWVWGGTGRGARTKKQTDPTKERRHPFGCPCVPNAYYGVWHK